MISKYEICFTQPPVGIRERKPNWAALRTASKVHLGSDKRQMSYSTATRSDYMTCQGKRASAIRNTTSSHIPLDYYGKFLSFHFATKPGTVKPVYNGQL